MMICRYFIYQNVDYLVLSLSQFSSIFIRILCIFGGFIQCDTRSASFGNHLCYYYYRGLDIVPTVSLR